MLTPPADVFVQDRAAASDFRYLPWTVWVLLELTAMKIRFRLLAVVYFAFLGAANVTAAPHLEPCIRYSDYHEHVERSMRQAWPEPLHPLILMFAPFAERGIGVTEGKDGYNLVRIEFDQSLWYGSWFELESEDDVAEAAADGVFRATSRDEDGSQRVEVQDFSRMKLRHSITLIPISDEFTEALIEVLAESVERAREEEPDDEIAVDGYTFEILLKGQSCVQLSSPQRGTEAGEIAELTRLLANRAQSWRDWSEGMTEAEAMELLNQIRLTR